MITEVTAVNFRQNLGEMINQVQYRSDSIVINKDGKPVAVLVDADLFARIRRMRERFDELSARIAGAFADLPPDQGIAEIDAVVARDRRSRDRQSRKLGNPGNGDLDAHACEWFWTPMSWCPDWPIQRVFPVESLASGGREVWTSYCPVTFSMRWFGYFLGFHESC